MAPKGEPSYSDLVYEVLQSAEEPLTFAEIFEAVSQRRPVTTKNPKATIRGALNQGRQLVSLGDGRYGYLPHRISGSRLRLPLTEKKPANHPLSFSDELRHALWPMFFETTKRGTRRPVKLRLPTGAEVTLTLGIVPPGGWGSPMPEELRAYLVANYAAAGDSLLIRITDGEAGLGEIVLEPQRKRDPAAVARRNQELADAVDAIIRRGNPDGMFPWDVVVPLLARGIYHDEIAPDRLDAVLKADPRFVDAGLGTYILAEWLTPERQTLINRRRAIEGLFKPDSAESIPEPAPEPPASANSVQSSRRAMEKSFADVGAILSQQNFSSLEEANNFLQNLMASGGVPRRRAETPLEQAQDLMYGAWDAARPVDRVRLAREALRISPDCADAYVLLAEETAHGPKEAAELYAKGVAAGERALGKDFFGENAGHFWGIIETRPYMRARMGLAYALWALGKRQEAIDHLWEMLRLNPGDNQGVRYVLLTWILEQGEEASVQTLLDRYQDDGAALWLYGSALHAFRAEGDSAAARKLRLAAKEQNPHVPGYLLGQKRVPRELPETIGFGDEREAVYCAAELLSSWKKTPGALAWLASAGPAARRV